MPRLKKPAKHISQVRVENERIKKLSKCLKQEFKNANHRRLFTPENVNNALRKITSDYLL